jgi:hypothetical protein
MSYPFAHPPLSVLHPYIHRFSFLETAIICSYYIMLINNGSAIDVHLSAKGKDKTYHIC